MMFMHVDIDSGGKIDIFDAPCILAENVKASDPKPKQKKTLTCNCPI